MASGVASASESVPGLAEPAEPPQEALRPVGWWETAPNGSVCAWRDQIGSVYIARKREGVWWWAEGPSAPPDHAKLLEGP